MTELKGNQCEAVLFDMPKAATYLGGLSPWTVRRKIYAGELVGVKIGARLLVERSVLDAYIRRSRMRGARQSPKDGLRDRAS